MSHMHSTENMTCHLTPPHTPNTHTHTRNASTSIIFMHTISHHQLNYRANLIIRGGWITKFSIQGYFIVSISKAIHIVALDILSYSPLSPMKATFEFMQVSESEIRFITVILKLLALHFMAWFRCAKWTCSSSYTIFSIPPTTHTRFLYLFLFTFEYIFISSVIRFVAWVWASGFCLVAGGQRARFFSRKMQTVTLW